MVRLGGGTAILRADGCVYTRCLFNSNNFETSAALAEVCALLSAVLVFIYLFILLLLCFSIMLIISTSACMVIQQI